jgi:hypothetical protein
MVEGSSTLHASIILVGNFEVSSYIFYFLFLVLLFYLKIYVYLEKIGPKLQVFLHAWWHFADQDLTVNADASVKGKSIKGSTARVSFVVREQFLPVSCLYGLRHMITPQTQEGEVYSIALGIDHAAVHYNASTICVLSDSLDAVRTFNDGKSYWDNKMEPDDKFSTKLKEAQRIVHLRGVKVVHVYRELNRAADFVSNVDHDHHDRAAEFFDGICLFWEQKKPIQKKLHDIFRDDIGLTVLVLKPVPGLYDEYDVVVPTLKRMLMGAVAIGDQWITGLFVIFLVFAIFNSFLLFC